ncbi:multidrug effflux MFS transporter [Pontibaca salina]|nr:multidrug effflux MFS transporter [Pontibaca salina]
MSALRVSLIGALFVAIGPIGMALYTPAMPEIVHAFGTSEGMVKMTLTLYFAGFALAQLIAGPVSDALGRRPVIMAFMAIFGGASLLALFAPNIEVFLVARFLQGVGASAGVAISRAIVRDQFRGNQSSEIMNTIGIILAIAPALSPTLGGVLVTYAGWQSLFLTMTLFGVFVVAVTHLGMQETIVADRNRLKFQALMRSYGKLFASRHFMTAALTIAGALGAIYTQATILPFILMDTLGMSPAGFGLAMILQSGSFFIGALSMRHLMKHHDASRLVAPGLGFILLGSAMFVTLFWGEPSLLRVMGPIGLYSFGVALVMPAMTTSALAPFPHIAGAASSLMGFLQMGAGLVMGSLAALFPDPVIAAAVLIPAMGAIACLSFLLFRRLPVFAEP